jgi:hypothetical protein
MDLIFDMLLFLGLVTPLRVDRTPQMVLAWVASRFTTSHARARAETLIPRGTMGRLEPPDRIVLLVAGHAWSPRTWR